jgi:hypothetical protein
MAQNSNLIKTKDRGAGEGWTREQGFLFCFFQFCHIENWGIFSKKIAKLLEFTPTLLSHKFSTFQISFWKYFPKNSVFVLLSLFPLGKESFDNFSV